MGIFWNGSVLCVHGSFDRRYTESKKKEDKKQFKKIVVIINCSYDLVPC